VTKFLQEQGFTKVKNMVGGMLRWATDVDPTVPRY
jgi:rhodanese-related sulfurtransferase